MVYYTLGMIHISLLIKCVIKLSKSSAFPNYSLLCESIINGDVTLRTLFNLNILSDQARYLTWSDVSYITLVVYITFVGNGSDVVATSNACHIGSVTRSVTQVSKNQHVSSPLNGKDAVL